MVRPTDDLVHVDVLHERHALPADLARMAERPQSGALCFVHQAIHQLELRGLVRLVQVALERTDALFDESADARAYFLPIGRRTGRDHAECS